MLGVSQRLIMGASGGAGGGGGAGAPVNAVRFDGTNDWLARGAALTGQADGQRLIISFWFKDQNVAGGTLFASPPSNRVFVQFSSKRLQVGLQTSAGATIWEAITTDVYDKDTNPGWHHVLISRDAAGSDRHFYVDDASVALDTDTNATGTINFNQATDWGVGASASGSFKVNLDLAEFYVNMAEFLDFSVEANRRKFISAAGKPVDLGADGSDPTSTAPIMFFSGDTVDWHTNKGSGGGFTENGALTDASSSPSD